jgi:hypothetical protein
MKALLCRYAGIRQVAAHCSQLVGTSNFSSLSHALRRISGVKFLQGLIGRLQASCHYGRESLVALDSMAVTMGKARRHRCQKYNNHAVGGGVLWSYCINAAAGTCPVRLLKLIRGAWNDAGLMRGIELLSNGPLYLMDRGFYCIDLIECWLKSGVRFIVRVKAGDLLYDIARHISQPRTLKSGWKLELDAIVHLGSPNRRGARPCVRLIIAISPKGEQFIYAASENKCSAGCVIEYYRQRWHIERFHRFMKESLGLAHLYSFDAVGLEFLILTALLTAMLLFTTVELAQSGGTIAMLHSALTHARKQLGIQPPWRRNILATKRSKPKLKTIKKR